MEEEFKQVLGAIVKAENRIKEKMPGLTDGEATKILLGEMFFEMEKMRSSVEAIKDIIINSLGAKHADQSTCPPNAD